MSAKKKDLKEFLREEIAKSGFPLEIEVSSILESLQWVVLNNQPFRDPDEEALRSIDVYAFHSPTTYEFSKNLPFGFSPKLLIECKKSNSHAWVFFTRPMQEKVFPMDGQVYDYPQAFSTKAFREKDTTVEKYFFYQYYFNSFASKTAIRSIHYRNFDRIAIAYQEYKIASLDGSDSGNKRNDSTTGRNDVLEAINQLVKFQEFDVRENINAPKGVKTASSPYFPVELSFLAIVFDGKLFEAVQDKGELSLKETNHLLLHFIYRPRNSFNNLNYFIDIVQKDHFRDFMTEIQEDIALLSSKIEAEKDKLLKYLKKDVYEPQEPAYAFG